VIAEKSSFATDPIELPRSASRFENASRSSYWVPPVVATASASSSSPAVAFVQVIAPPAM